VSVSYYAPACLSDVRKRISEILPEANVIGDPGGRVGLSICLAIVESPPRKSWLPPILRAARDSPYTVPLGHPPSAP